MSDAPLYDFVIDNTPPPPPVKTQADIDAEAVTAATLGLFDDIARYAATISGNCHRSGKAVIWSKLTAANAARLDGILALLGEAWSRLSPLPMPAMPDEADPVVVEEPVVPVVDPPVEG